jgi:hypothetical protein
MEVDVVAKRAEIAHPAFWRLRSTIASWVAFQMQFGLVYYYNDSKMEGPICRSRFLNLTARRRAFRCGSAPTAKISSPWKITGGTSEMTFVPVSKSGSSKVSAIAASRR